MNTDDRAHIELEDRLRRDLAAIPVPREDRWLPGVNRSSNRLLQLALWVPLAIVLVVAGLVAGEQLRQRQVPGMPVVMPPAAETPFATRTPTTTTPVTRGPTAVSPDIANVALAARARDTGRTAVAVCLYVDPASGIDAAAALASLQGSIDSLVRQGYTVLEARPASPCAQVPLYIRTGTVHPKNSGSGPVAPVPAVTTPSEFQLFFVVTSAVRMGTIFGAPSSHRGTEEICQGQDCGSVTESIYTDAIGFASASERERLLLDGFGLLGPP